MRVRISEWIAMSHMQSWLASKDKGDVVITLSLYKMSSDWPECFIVQGSSWSRWVCIYSIQIFLIFQQFFFIITISLSIFYLPYVILGIFQSSIKAISEYSFSTPGPHICFFYIFQHFFIISLSNLCLFTFHPDENPYVNP